MPTPLISARGLGKKYTIGQPGSAIVTLRDRITDAVRSMGRKKAFEPREFWALRDVSFDLHVGDVIGVIGRNGAGKSTLLKVLSEITEPTEGEARVYGRVASLLEVGVGFHPELSGRENVYLNGAILGMTRSEIRRKFDEIVAFAEIEQFIDTPVKRYSSGMYIRLAFSVAAHLEPDVLIVDEVLAVGDIAFQKKCLGKLEDISTHGRAVLVVTHNMAIVTQLCEKVIWLDRGSVVRSGPTREVVAAYLAIGAAGNAEWKPPIRASEAFEFHSVAVEHAGDDPVSIPADEDFSIVFDFDVRGPLPPGRMGLLITDSSGSVVFGSASTDGLPAIRKPWKRGRQRLRCVIPGHFLAPGQYFVTVSEPIEDSEIIPEHVLSFTITEQNSLVARDNREGVIAPRLPWDEERAP
jgi:lipopolysaccharide transport system ATP-binding protein